MPGPLRFEWYGPKAATNRAKHRVTFEEASTVFGDPLGRITDDPRHERREYEESKS
ncbi:MAG: BrnT family toxin [Candidatus Rokubacteria bacterium]|nr:BrnT family toxin [Candidatus Rokubacteria bacterium]